MRPRKDEVAGVRAVPRRQRREVFLEAWNALLGRRPALTAAQHERLRIILRGWHEERAAKKPAEPEDDE